MFGVHTYGECTAAKSACNMIATSVGELSTKRTRTLPARYRLAWALIIASILVALFAAWAAAYRMVELFNRGKEYTYATIVIRKGDTLWDIAVQYGPKGWDPRKTLHHIAELNQISPQSYARLQPGDRIAVPVSLNDAPSDVEPHVRVAFERHSSVWE